MALLEHDYIGWLRARPFRAQLAVVALTYYVAGEIGLRLSLVGRSVTPLWPPTGIAVVALLALGRRVWPAITIAAAVINLPIGPSVAGALVIAVGNTLAPLGAVVMLAAVEFRRDLARVRDAAALVFLAAFAAMAISATVGTLVLLSSGAIAAHKVAGTWSVWWTGDAMGVLLVAPFLWSLWPRRSASRRHGWWEVVATGCLLVVACAIAMAAKVPLLFVVVPVVGVVAWRFGQRGAARADLVVSILATILAAHEVGAFSGLSLLGRMVTLQSFNATVVFTSLLLAAAVSQRADVAAVQRKAVETLQRSLLPGRLPIVAGLEFAARYIPASEHVELGGDWYDVLALDNGCVGVVIGDVAGHGILAAAVMGKIRMALRAFALDGRSPCAALQQLNTLLHSVQEDATATVWYGQYDPATRLLVFSNAGHVPPLVIDAAGGHYLDDVHGPPIGALEDVHFAQTQCTVDGGATLFLYTDGLVERRHDSIDDGLAALEKTAARNDTDLEQTCDHVLHALQADTSEDDIALLAMRVRAPAREIHIERQATRASVPETRHDIEVWLNKHGVARSDAFDVLTATTEACANVVVHAYGLTTGPMEVTARLSDSQLQIIVTDDGAWRTPTHAKPGRGLSLMRALMDHVEIATTPRTQVRMQRTLNRPRDD